MKNMIPITYLPILKPQKHFKTAWKKKDWTTKILMNNVDVAFKATSCLKVILMVQCLVIGWMVSLSVSLCYVSERITAWRTCLLQDTSSQQITMWWCDDLSVESPYVTSGRLLQIWDFHLRQWCSNNIPISTSCSFKTRETTQVPYHSMNILPSPASKSQLND